MTSENIAENQSDTSGSEDDLPSYIVCIGASAGGLESIERFFRAMPVDTRLAFVVIQHLSPDFKSLMRELLERFTTMPVVSVEDHCKVKANHIYHLMPKQELMIEGAELVSHNRVKEGSTFHPINTLLRSLAQEWGEKTIAIILSGTGTDGSLGVSEIREAGGLVIAESLDSARFLGMPQSIIKSALADAILEPGEMPEFILDYIANPQVQVPTELNALTQQEQKDVQSVGIPIILDLLRKEFDIDFSLYKSGTIGRRIERRLSLEPGAKDYSLSEYIEKVRSDPNILNALYKDLLIGVTSFFRDKEAFKVLQEDIIPGIVERTAKDEDIRVWVCGCSTGEEAYSIAILFLESLEEQGKTNSLKVFATDLHEASLQIAANGVYDEDSMQGIPDPLRKKYFDTLDKQRFKVQGHLRRCLIFSRHNLLSDPPFTHIHLVSCRNVLIYFKAIAQTRALAAFHYAMIFNGVLFLGSSESMRELTNEFEVIHRQWKLFRKVRVSRVLTNMRALSAGILNERHTMALQASNMQQDLYDGALAALMPNGFIINEQQEIMHILGNAKDLVSPDSGRLSVKLTFILNKDMQLSVLSGMRLAAKQMQSVKIKDIKVSSSSAGNRFIDIEIIPFHPKASQDICYLLLLNDALQHPVAVKDHAKNLQVSDLSGDLHDYVRDLELELQKTRESLQNTVEELETSNEELQASNEELLASNEELQSTNEELHSVNEELFSVNAEHELKIDQLNHMSTDLKNLIHSIDSAIIFVDEQFAIRLFTPKARQIFAFMTQDIGRDIRHFKISISDDQIIADIANVLEQGQTLERLLNISNSTSYLRRCSPLINEHDKCSGVVINYIDTSQITNSSRALHESETRFERILQTTPNAVLVTNQFGLIRTANVYAQNLLGHKKSQLVGLNINQFIPSLTADMLLCPQETIKSVQAYRLDKSTFMVDINTGAIELDGDAHVIWTILDVTAAQATEKAREAALIETQRLADARHFFLANMSHEIRTPLSGIIGFANLGSQPSYYNNADKSKNNFEKISACSEHLLRIVNDILDFSKLDSGSVECVMQPVEIIQLLQEAVESIRFLAEKNSLVLKIEKQDLTSVYLKTDPVRFRQILDNLLSNAVKFTSHGGVTVHVKKHEGRLIIQIIDTGVGIAKDDIERIFKPFEQVDPSYTRRHGGTGLGLAITQKLVNMLQGQIDFVSTKGEGTQVTLSFPLLKTPMLELPQEIEFSAKKSITDYDFTGINILVAEDEPVIRDFIGILLEEQGAEVTIFPNGQELLAFIEQHDKNLQSYHVILMDIQMPVMNGFEATTQIRKFAPDIPIIALTAHALSEYQQQCEEQGMTDYVSKPINESELFEMVYRYTNKK
jgi:two-component system CheB/CheR fusion protein